MTNQNDLLFPPRGKRNVRAKQIWGTPKEKARRLSINEAHSKFLTFRPIWEYRGFFIKGTRNTGWNAGSTWRVLPPSPTGYLPYANSKLVLMVKIDRHLANPEQWKSEQSA